MKPTSQIDRKKCEKNETHQKQETHNVMRKRDSPNTIFEFNDSRMAPAVLDGFSGDRMPSQLGQEKNSKYINLVHLICSLIFIQASNVTIEELFAIMTFEGMNYARIKWLNMSSEVLL